MTPEKKDDRDRHQCCNDHEDRKVCLQESHHPPTHQLRFGLPSSTIAPELVAVFVSPGNACILFDPLVSWRKKEPRGRQT
jgi:hypothetical protein